MHDFNPIDIARGKLVKRYDILGVVVFDFKQIGNKHRWDKYYFLYTSFQEILKKECHNRRV